MNSYTLSGDTARRMMRMLKWWEQQPHGGPDGLIELPGSRNKQIVKITAVPSASDSLVPFYSGVVVQWNALAAEFTELGDCWLVKVGNSSIGLDVDSYVIASASGLHDDDVPIFVTSVSCCAEQVGCEGCLTSCPGGIAGMPWNVQVTELEFLFGPTPTVTFSPALCQTFTDFTYGPSCTVLPNSQRITHFFEVNGIMHRLWFDLNSSDCFVLVVLTLYAFVGGVWDDVSGGSRQFNNWVAAPCDFADEYGTVIVPMSSSSPVVHINNATTIVSAGSC